MIIITARVGGFRRAGVAHPAQATEYPDDAFAPEQVEALQAEPMLVVEIRAEKAKPKKDPAEQAAKE